MEVICANLYHTGHPGARCYYWRKPLDLKQNGIFRAKDSRFETNSSAI